MFQSHSVFLIIRSLTQLTLQANEDTSLHTAEVSQTMKKILNEMRDRKETLSQLFDNWTMHVSQSKAFKTQWNSFLEESRKVNILYY